MAEDIVNLVNFVHVFVLSCFIFVGVISASEKVRDYSRFEATKEYFCLF